MKQAELMRRMHEIRKDYGYSKRTALRLAWREARGTKGYALHIEPIRRDVCQYVTNLVGNVKDIHDFNKHQILRDALSLEEDADGIIVVDGKTAGLLKYAARNA